LASESNVSCELSETPDLLGFAWVDDALETMLDVFGRLSDTAPGQGNISPLRLSEVRAQKKALMLKYQQLAGDSKVSRQSLLRRMRHDLLERLCP
jgi:hypothetical protein